MAIHQPNTNLLFAAGNSLLRKAYPHLILDTQAYKMQQAAQQKKTQTEKNHIKFDRWWDVLEEQVTKKRLRKAAQQAIKLHKFVRACERAGAW